MGAEKIIRISDFPTVATLMLLKHHIISIDRSEPMRVVFEFEATDNLHKDLEKLISHNILVDPLDFWETERQCKKLIYQRPGDINTNVP